MATRSKSPAEIAEEFLTAAEVRKATGMGGGDSARHFRTAKRYVEEGRPGLAVIYFQRGATALTPWGYPPNGQALATQFVVTMRELEKATTFEVGDRVEGGEPGTEDYDTGKVSSVKGDHVTVSWNSLGETTQAAGLLRRHN